MACYNTLHLLSSWKFSVIGSHSNEVPDFFDLFEWERFLNLNTAFFVPVQGPVCGVFPLFVSGANLPNDPELRKEQIWLHWVRWKKKRVNFNNEFSM